MSSNWTTVTESKYPWKRETLKFVHDQFPQFEPYRAWANFEFIADDGSINEVDLLLFTPHGLFLIEIKSRPGHLFGDAGTWTWENEGRLSTLDSPLIAANLKAKKLSSLLQRQKAFQEKGRIPFIEALTDDTPGEHLDVFSLGAIAYHIFSGVAPAANGLELSNKLRETGGLQISSVLNGAGEDLQCLIQCSTDPVVPDRTGTVVDFLGVLDDVENELTSPDHDYVEDPALAKPGELIPGGYKVVKRIGQGACSIVLLVEREGKEYVLKVASDPQHNNRLKDEADVLQKLCHPHIIEFACAAEVGDRLGFLMWAVLADKNKRIIETLGHRLRKEGRLHVDLLQRFGEDLLDVVNHLEEQGIPHRDIKPDNIAVGMVGRGDRLHAVLFDFSLSRTPADNIRAGTTGYIDPLLPLRKPPRWDLHAERYAAAVTLYELATGGRPQWGDGSTDPSHLPPGTAITINPEAFDVALREGLTAFFQKQTWELQREEDRTGKRLDIPVPPKYTSADFLKSDHWRLRSKLDVPKERWVSFPHCEGPDGTPVIAWAGYDHLQLARAISTDYVDIQERLGGRDDPRLIPLLACLLELLRWLKQWHNEPDAAFDGLRMGDHFGGFVQEEARQLNKTVPEIKAWQPPPRAARGRKQRT